MDEINHLIERKKLSVEGNSVIDPASKAVLFIREGKKYFFADHPAVEYVPRNRRGPEIFEAMREGEKTSLGFLGSRGHRTTPQWYAPNPASHAWLTLYDPLTQKADDMHFTPHFKNRIASPEAPRMVKTFKEPVLRADRHPVRGPHFRRFQSASAGAAAYSGGRRVSPDRAAGAFPAHG